LGAAYRELGKNRASAIFHLQKAVLNITENYDASTYKEGLSTHSGLTLFSYCHQVDKWSGVWTQKNLLGKLKKYGDQRRRILL